MYERVHGKRKPWQEIFLEVTIIKTAERKLYKEKSNRQVDNEKIQLDSAHPIELVFISLDTCNVKFIRMDNFLDHYLWNSENNYRKSQPFSEDYPRLDVRLFSLHRYDACTRGQSVLTLCN